MTEILVWAAIAEDVAGQFVATVLAAAEFHRF